MLVRTRFAPSPTGFLHIGGLRTALYEYAFAKSQKGDFVLRIEDTDRKRFVPGATEKLIDILHLFGLNWDEGPGVGGVYNPYIQSERVKTGIYKKYAEKLIEQGNAYYCFCEAKDIEEIKNENEHKQVELRDECRNLSMEESKERIKKGEIPAIRLRVPDEGEVSYYDFVLQKDISWENKSVDEAMLLKSDGFPTYHLAAVVDDVEMKISHILRGMEWLPSTPIHLLLYKFLEFKRPNIGHFPIILDPSGGKLSKRKGAVSCEEFLAEGYLPEAILNFIMLLGWAPKDNRELFTLKEFVENFQKGNIQTTNAVFNREKLDWFNGHYIRNTEDSVLADLVWKYLHEKYDKEKIALTIPLIKERINKLSEYWPLAEFFFKTTKPSKELFGKTYKSHLQAAYNVLEGLESWNLETINENLMSQIKKDNYKVGDFFMDLRIAITGKKFTPPINDSLVILGKQETLARLNNVLNI